MNAPVFLASLAVTVALLVLTLWTGKSARRRAHFVSAPLTVVALAVAIWQAEMFGRDWEFDHTKLTVHLWCAGTALALLPGTAVSGLMLARDPRWRAAHKRWLAGFVVATLLAVATACWMFVGAVPVAG